MKVSGFTIIRNGVYYDYPFIEAIKSVLPLCDEFVVNLGITQDGTKEKLIELNDSRLKIIEREWDMASSVMGSVLAVETNAALKECSGDWCFYIQSDEVLHEQYLPVVKSMMENYLDKPEIEGLRFQYLHFYGNYDYIQDNYRKWYVKATRVIRNSPDIRSVGDAMEFGKPGGDMLNTKDIPAKIYHYGWVRPPESAIKKRIDFEKIYHDEKKAAEIAAKLQNYKELGDLVIFKGKHPAVMQERVKQNNWDFDAKLELQRPDWLRKILIFLHPVTKRIKRVFSPSGGNRDASV